jgi:CzcA family heavy metal efflux pump
MLQRLVDLSIRFRGVVITLACVLLVYGIYTTMHAKLDVFPDFVQPQVVIQTEAPGLSPEQVEALVTQPVENTVGGVGNVESVRSQSIQGLSIVTVVFGEGADIFIARQMLNERLNEIAGSLPMGVKSPKMTPLTSATMDLLKIGLVSDKLNLTELRTFADWTFAPRLRAVPGISSVGVMGGDVAQLQIQVKPDRLLVYNLTLDDLLAAARKATGVRGAGFIENANQRIVLRTDGQSITPERLGEAVITYAGGMSVRLKDVARVVEAPALKVGDAVIMGRPGVLLKLLSQYGSNTMNVTLAVEKALKEMEDAGMFRELGIRIYPAMHRPATFIETAIRDVRTSLLIGGVLVVIVLFLFLFNLRSAFISITAIPLSLLVAIIILDRFGMTLNTITLGGLAIAIGEVVDDAIIDVENIFRRLRENRTLPVPRPVHQVVLDASLEVRSAVVYATFVVVLVFVPVLTMTGLQGRFFAPLGLAYVLAILASLGVALTVTPALCTVLLPKRAERTKEPRFLAAIKAGYRHLMVHFARWPKAIMVVGLALCAGAIALIPTFGGEFLPTFREGHFVLQVNAVPGTSLPDMLRLGRQITGELLKIPEIATVEQQAGRAELGEDPWGPNRSELHVELKRDIPGERQEEIQNEIRDILAKYPGINYEVLTFLGDRIGETITGETAAVVVNIFGTDLDVLDQKAQEVAQAISGVKGATDVRVAAPPGTPETVVQLRPEKLKQFGFQPTDVLDAIETGYQGTNVAQAYRGNQVIDVVVLLEGEHRRDPEGIGSLVLRNPQGTHVALSELAEVYPTTGRSMVLHDGARRRQTVTCNVQGRDVSSFVAEAEAKLARTVAFPPGTYADFSGAAEARAAAQRQILLHSAIAGLAILLLLATVFGNWRNLALVLTNLPFALVGGVLAVFLTGGSLSIGSLVGFVTLFGITMRNSMMMISHFEHLVTKEGMTWGLDAALRGASERLVPILMTALVTGLGLLPIALGSGEAGREIEGPMAIVILGGLATSTLLNLLIVPTLALRFGRFGQAKSA